FISRCRKTELSPQTLLQQIAVHKSKWQVEADFLDIMVELYGDYLTCLKVEGKEDFDGLLRRATAEIAAGQTEFTRFMKKQHGDLAKLRFLLIDEYQDFSKLFHSMVEAIRQRNTDLKLFCVGDDWQAINGFAGSDLSYYENFSSNFPNSKQLQISTNYRSAKGVVAVGNAVMRGRGKPAIAHSADSGHVWMAMPGLFAPTVNEQTRHGDDKITPMVLRLAAWALERNQDIVVLCRTQNPLGFVNYKAHQGADGGSQDNGIERFQVLLRSYFPEHLRSKIKVSTAHGFKGLQGSVVVILDAVAGCYPLIHQDWIFLRLFGESVQTITDEARRLFYVALTRAVDSLVIFTDGNKKSPFLADVEQHFPLRSIKWADFAAVAAKSDRLKVFVGNQLDRGSSPTHAIKDFVQQDGYKRSSLYGNFCWVRSFAQSDLNINTLTSSKWSECADGVEVHILDEQDNLVGNYRIDAGKWTALMEYSSKA
ncbi:MAG: UvrD-helicase domain-containing protein, partial [Rhodoferax sp.]|nr:UvrD-helicase domain-containing protein [Rhodoferax sp.]